MRDRPTTVRRASNARSSEAEGGQGARVRRNRGRRFLFVGGPPRSGTTLFQNMLDSHPRICGAPEFRHAPDLVRLRRDLRRSFDRGWIVDFATLPAIDDHICDFMEKLLIPMADRYEADLLSEKTPQNVLVFKDLMELFPAARFVFMMRDPRAVVASLLRVGERGRRIGTYMPPHTVSVLAAAAYVHECLQTGCQALRAAPKRVLLLRYEELVTYPERETRRVCRFLGLQWSPRMLTPARFPHPGEGAIVNDIWYSRDSFYRDPSPEGMDRWRTDLTPGMELVVTRRFRRDRRSVAPGYDLVLAGSRLRAARAQLGYLRIILVELFRRTGHIIARLGKTSLIPLAAASFPQP